MNKDQIIERLDKSKFYQEMLPSLRINGKPEALALCPFHDDHNPSLSVNLETGLYFCPVCSDGGDVFKFYMRLRQVSFKEALNQLSVYSGKSGEKVPIKIEAVYPYTDEAGRVLFEVVRYIPKTFRQRRPDGNGGCIYNLEGVRIVPYNLPKVIESDTVYICEGEKDCDNLASLGLTATTNPQGAGKWKEEFGQYFTGKDVIVLCDNDEVGKKHGNDVAQKLSKYAKTIKIVEQLPGVPEKGDVSDWLKLNPDTTENQRAKLLELVKNAPVWTPKECDKHNSTMILTRLDSLFKEPEESTTWLVDGLLPTGGFSVLVAKPKVGKSTKARTLALHVAKGEPFLNRAVVKGVVIYLALEEKRSEVKKHFQDMGATGNEEIHIYTGGTPVDAIKQIREATERLKPVLVIIDPLFRLTKVKDGNDYIQVTNALDPLLRLSRDTGTHVLCVHHSPKGERNAEDCILGSQAIFGSVDTLLIMKRHESYRTIQTIQRYGQDMEETILNFDRETRLVTIGGTRHEQDVNMMKKAIIDFLSTQNEPITESVINQGIEGAVKFKCKALRELVAENKIKREGKGSKGNPYKYSTILLPSICAEVEKENQKTTGNPHGCQDYSTIPDFDNFPKDEKSKIVESLPKNEGEPVSEKESPFEVELLEIVK